MININMTILVQMVNFIIAYIIIRYLLLDPAVQIVTEQEAETFQSKNAIDQLQHAHQTQLHDKANRWATCQRTLALQAPQVSAREKSMLGKEPDTALRTPKPTSEEIKPLANQIAKELTERLSHVH